MSAESKQINDIAYSEIARSYAVRRREMTLDAELDQFLDMLPCAGPILDAGCGAGRDLGLIQTRVNDRALMGLDISPAMLGQAKSENGSGRAMLIRASITDLPVATESVAGVWCSTVLPHLDAGECERAIAEFVRVLVPGGVLMSTVKLGSGEGSEVAEEFDRVRRWVRYTSAPEFLNLLDRNGLRVAATDVWLESLRYGGSGRGIEFISTLSVA